MFKGQVRVIAGAGASACMKLLTLGPRISRFFFFSFIVIQIGMEHSRIYFTIFSLRTFRKITYYFIFMPCQYFLNNDFRKNSKFEREDKTNGKPLLHHGFFFFFYQIFPMNIQKGYLLFFLCPVSTPRRMNAKKNSKFEREDKSNGKPFLHNGFFFFFQQFYPNFKSFWKVLTNFHVFPDFLPEFFLLETFFFAASRFRGT